MKRLTQMEFDMLEHVSASRAKQTQHNDIMDYLTKSIMGGPDAKIYYRYPGRNNYQLFDGHPLEKWLNIVDMNVALSLCRMETPDNEKGPHVEVLVDKDGLEAFLETLTERL